MPKEYYKFNPSLGQPHTLQKTLVGREKELFRILNKIEECAKGTSLRHFLITGSRGIGKTHFLLLIYYTVRGNITWNDRFKNLNRFWIPIRFAEEEYRIANLGEFLLRIRQELEKETLDSETKLSTSVRGALGSLEQAETEKLIAILVRNREQTGKRFILLIDNFHEILARFTEEDRGRLRDILISKDLFMLIGTAPTLFEEVTDYEQPFYNFFENVQLRSLNEDEGANLIYKWWEQENRQDSIKDSEALRPKIDALLHLTGGNPRLILSLYSIISEAKILEVEGAFTALLDDLTPYFQLRMKELSSQQAKILDAMALMDGPSNPTQIAKESNLDIRKVTSQLKRMEKSGYVSLLKERGKRKAVYDIKERLFRLWRQMRVEAGKRHLKFIVTVIRIWYSEAELEKQFKKVSSELDLALHQKQQDKAEQVLKHLWYLQEACPSHLYTKIFSKRLDGLIECGDFETASEEIQQLIKKGTEKQNEKLLAIAYWYEAVLHNERKEPDKEVGALNRYLDLRPDDSHGWHNLGHLYIDLKLHQEAIEAFKKAAQIAPRVAPHWYCMGVAYLALNFNEESIEAYRKAVDIEPDLYDAWNNMGVALSRLARYKEAIEILLKATTIDSGRIEAWGNLGIAYRRTKQYQEAVESQRKLLQIQPDNIEGLSELASSLLRLHYDKEALETCEKAVKIKPDAPGLRELLAHALYHLGNYKESIQADTEAIELAPSTPLYYLCRGHTFETIGIFTKALRDFKKGLTLAQTSRDEESMKDAAEDLVRLNLSYAAKRATQNRSMLAEKSLKEGLSYARTVSAEKLQELMTVYLNRLLQQKKSDFLMKSLELVEQAKLDGLEESMKFYRIAGEYLKTKDRTKLNQLFPELRELIEGLDKTHK